MRKRWYTVYDGDEVVASGTARECAEKLGEAYKSLSIETYLTHDELIALVRELRGDVE